MTSITYTNEDGDVAALVTNDPAFIGARSTALFAVMIWDVEADEHVGTTFRVSLDDAVAYAERAVA